MRGVAIRSEPQTNVDIVGCKFERNSSSDLGTIFNRGSMKVMDSKFNQNFGSVS